jgi:116 kDa U5 small nuclear ribonucleoprotein component
VLGEEPKELRVTLAQIGVKLKPKQLSFNPKPLLRCVLGQFLGATGGLVDMLAKYVPSPVAAAPLKVSIHALLLLLLHAYSHSLTHFNISFEVHT